MDEGTPCIVFFLNIYCIVFFLKIVVVLNMNEGSSPPAPATFAG